MFVDKLSPGDMFKNDLGGQVVVEKAIDEGGYVTCRLRRESGSLSGFTYKKVFFTSKGRVNLEGATNYKPCSLKTP